MEPISAALMQVDVKMLEKWVILTLGSFNSFHPNSQIGTGLNRNIYSANLNEIPVAG